MSINQVSGRHVVHFGNIAVLRPTRAQAWDDAIALWTWLHGECGCVK